MTDWRERAQALMKELEQERDELRVKLHLAKADAKDELTKMDAQFDAKIAELKQKMASLDKDGDGSVVDDLGDVAKGLADELRSGFSKIREKF